MPQRTKPGVNWAEIEQKVRAGQSTTSLAKEHDVTRQSIDKKALKEGWKDGPQKWLPAARQTQTAHMLQDPQTTAEKCIATRGNRTPETQAAILWSLEQGMSMAQASEANGIKYEMFNAWRKSDEVFDRLVWQARHQLLGGMQTEIVKSARRGDWKAAESVLKASPETRKDWSNNNAGAGGINVTINIRGESDIPVVDVTPHKDTE